MALIVDLPNNSMFLTPTARNWGSALWTVLISPGCASTFDPFLRNELQREGNKWMNHGVRAMISTMVHMIIAGQSIFYEGFHFDAATTGEQHSQYAPRMSLARSDIDLPTNRTNYHRMIFANIFVCTTNHTLVKFNSAACAVGWSCRRRLD